MDRRQRGIEGEQLVAAWYEEVGYEILARNWRCERGELDLVCRRGRTLVVCEVKARASAAYGAPAEAVTRAKQQRVRRLAVRWLAQHPTSVAEVRFDVAAVIDGAVEVIPAAF